MATTKQIKAIYALSKVLGKPVKYDELHKLTDEEASDEIQQLQTCKEEGEDKPPTEKKTVFEPITHGLAFKLTWQKWIAMERNVLEDSRAFKIDVCATYWLIKKTEKTVREDIENWGSV